MAGIELRLALKRFAVLGIASVAAIAISYVGEHLPREPNRGPELSLGLFPFLVVACFVLFVFAIGAAFRDLQAPTRIIDPGKAWWLVPVVFLYWAILLISCCVCLVWISIIVDRWLP